MTPTSAGGVPLDGRWLVIGVGRAGLPLARLLHEQGVLAGVSRRRPGPRPPGLDPRVPIAVGALPDVDATVDTLLFAVPDDTLRRLVAAFPDPVRERTDLVWIHVSGSHPAAVFRSAGVRGSVGACHPLCSLAGGPDDLARLAGVFFGVDGEGAARARADALARAAGGVPGAVPADARVGYHAAAVLASNGVYALLETARVVCEAAGLADPALADGLATLAAGSADNARRLPLPEAATGPLVRGDAGTVREHLAWLDRAAPDSGRLYRSLSERLADLAERGGAPDAVVTAVRTLLAAERER